MIALTKNKREELIKEIIGGDPQVQSIKVINPNRTYFTAGQIMPVYATNWAVFYCVDVNDDNGEPCMHRLDDLVADGVIFEYVGFL